MVTTLLIFNDGIYILTKTFHGKNINSMMKNFFIREVISPEASWHM